MLASLCTTLATELAVLDVGNEEYIQLYTDTLLISLKNHDLNDNHISINF